MRRYLGDCLRTLSEALFSSGRVPSCKNFIIGAIHVSVSGPYSGMTAWTTGSSVMLDSSRRNTVTVLGSFISEEEASLASSSAWELCSLDIRRIEQRTNLSIRVLTWFKYLIIWASLACAEVKNSQPGPNRSTWNADGRRSRSSRRGANHSGEVKMIQIVKVERREEQIVGSKGDAMKKERFGDDGG
ncbi:hypothetical protein LWI29_015844 [Acer saccharum]|uniref:Uncharacterized protein n=1 Tax=Acer saccharum TaxID=4024 RepID=A0AA39T3E2_ACESA|nr:hypothetical protein LWI29_015844 [Acer saccharum]